MGTNLFLINSFLMGGGAVPTIPLINPVYASAYGAVSNADLSEGSTTFGTDNTAALDDLFDAADGVTFTTIVIDGAYGTTGGHKLKSNN